jgi:hypothetical protein
VKRRGFLKSTGAALVALRYGKLPDAAPAVAAPVEAAAANHWAGEQIVASGGLCSPLAPIYQLPAHLQGQTPIRTALPSFSVLRSVDEE